VLSEVTDAMGKQVQMLEVPVEVAWEKVGYSQTEIQRMSVLRQQSQLTSAALTPPPVLRPAASIPAQPPAQPAPPTLAGAPGRPQPA
jgi:hypothetical protein